MISLGLKEYKEIWKFHLRPWSKLPLFPRDFSSRDKLVTVENGVERPTPLNRATVANEQQYLQSLSSVYKKKDCYVSVFSDWQIEHNIFDTIFLEFDSHDENGSVNMTELMLTKHLLDKKFRKLKIAFRSMFSTRGFHYYLDFEPSYMKDYKSTVLDFLEKQNILELIDTSVLESARISRIPNTKHLKTGKFSVYVVDKMTVDEILKESENNSILIETYSDRQKTKILDYLDLYIKPPKVSADKQYENEYSGWYPDCVIGIMEKILNNQHATHLERVHLTGYLKRFGLSDIEILEYFKNTSDFNYDICMAQIESLDQYSNFSCRNVRLLFKGLCPGMCEYIRNVARRQNP